MNTGTITLQYFDNYGSVLQAYALQTFLESLGYKNEIIDYQPTYPSGISVFYHGFLNAWHESGLMKALYISLQFVRGKYSGKATQEVLAEKKRIFADFRVSHLSIGAQKYQSHDELFQHPPKYDAYITGSDNLWLVDWEGGIPERRLSYYLDFAPGDALKLSYAVSTSNPHVNKKHLPHFIHLISGIDFISVRGESTASTLHELTDAEIASVVDPTLLLTNNEWNALFPDTETSPSNRPYVLVYVIYPMSRKSSLYSYIQKISQDNDWDVYYIAYTFQTTKSQYNYVSVEKFLAYFSHAELVITNSFHGTAFSLIFRKPFYAFYPQEGRSRITDLLDAVHLSDRFVDEGRDIASLKAELDYTTSNTYIEECRIFSSNWLKSALDAAGLRKEGAS